MEFAASNDEHYLLLLQEQASRGDESAFRKIFNLFYDRLRRFALATVKSDEGAVEIVDDVFVKMWKRKESISSIQNLRIYLFAATKNTALNYLSWKAHGKTTEPFDYASADSPSGPSPEQIMIMTEIMAKMNEAVDALPPRCKIIFNMVREDGLKYKEVADILHISVNTVDAQMVIAVNRLKNSVKEYLDVSDRTNFRKKSLLLLGSFLLAAVL